MLGDNSIFYILLNRQPPYISNSYNDSPIYLQQTVLDWFHRKNPRFVIWVPDDLVYDHVPHTVRLPLIYTYVVEHYEFLREIGPYHILAERPPDHPPDLEYWRRVLGGRVDLGFIPGRARLADYAACGGRCSPLRRRAGGEVSAVQSPCRAVSWPSMSNRPAALSACSST